MGIILSSVKWQSAIVLLDEVVIILKSPDKHIDHVRQVFLLLKDTAVTLKLKWEQYTDCIDYLGHVIKPRCLQAISQTIEAVLDLQRLFNCKKLRSFLA